MTTWHEAIEAFNDFLDEVYSDFEIAGMTYRPSYVLENTDPTAYRVMFHDWADSDGMDTDDLEGVCELP
jgi:hypothetical protein